jgi:hypothetical protein
MFENVPEDIDVAIPEPTPREKKITVERLWGGPRSGKLLVRNKSGEQRLIPANESLEKEFSIDESIFTEGDIPKYLRSK